MKNLPVGVEFFPCGRQGWTDGHDEANSRFLQFCEKCLQPYVIIGHNIPLMGSVRVHKKNLFNN
jgi:hypothetical protein